MSDKILDYFEDLSKKKLINTESPSTNIIFSADQRKFATVKKAKIKDSDIQYYWKKTELHSAIASVASANMYNSIGLTTPPISILKTPLFFKAKTTQTLQQDATQFQELECAVARKNKEYMKMTYQFMGRYKWEILYDSNFRFDLLKIMTFDCVDQLISMFLVDELRTDCDRHTNNFLLYKQKGHEKFEGVIPIDLEQMELFIQCSDKKDSFDNFITIPYSTMTPQQTQDSKNYIDRVKAIRELIQDGVIPKDSLEKLVSALQYDLPKEFKTACNKEGLYAGKTYNSIVTPISRLHEYNRKTIGRDLGL